MTPTKQNLCQKLRNAELAFKRFWFTGLDSVSAEEPTGILEKIFFTPKDFEQGAVYGFRD